MTSRPRCTSRPQRPPDAWSASRARGRLLAELLPELGARHTRVGRVLVHPDPRRALRGRPAPGVAAGAAGLRVLGARVQVHAGARGGAGRPGGRRDAPGTTSRPSTRRGSPGEAVRRRPAAARRRWPTRRRPSTPVRPLAPGLRWVPPERWHLTLAFYGEVPDDEVDRVVARTGRRLDGAVELRLALAGAGHFGGRARLARRDRRRRGAAVAGRCPGPRRAPLPAAPHGGPGARRHRHRCGGGGAVRVRRAGLDRRGGAPRALAARPCTGVRRCGDLAAPAAPAPAVGSGRGPEDPTPRGAGRAGRARPRRRPRRRPLTLRRESTT